eukprot:61889-Prymnesium_polylepis.1
MYRALGARAVQRQLTHVSATKREADSPPAMEDDERAKDAAAAAASVAAAAAEAAANRPRLEGISKTEASQEEAGANSYYYWHSKVPQGASAAPKPTPQLLSTGSASTAPTATKAIGSYSLLDEGE